MAANILTPLMLWRSFSFDKKPRLDVISTKQTASAVIQKIYIDGRTTKTGTVKIYGVSACPKDMDGDLPTIIVFSGGKEEYDERIASFIAKNGYHGFVFNLYGKREDCDRYTLYPDDIAYANFGQSKDSLQKVKRDVKHTCWYEWSSAARYVFNTVKSMDGIGKIGVVGIKEFATPVWHLAANEKDLSAMASLFGFGWETNRGLYKFGDQLEPKFSDETLMYVAGIEPESYAMHVKCPTLVLTSTNNSVWDVDRAYDTVSKISDDYFRAVNYSVNFTDSLSSTAPQNLKLFFDAILKGDGEEFKDCPTKCDMRAECKFGKLYFDLTIPSTFVEKVELYVAEEIIDPSKRCWKRIEHFSNENGKFQFEYLPYADSMQVVYFAKMIYKNGFIFSTPVATKKFSSSEITVSHKSCVVYSGRDENAESVFSPLVENQLVVKPDEEVVEKSGPMGIKGMSTLSGVQTFRINAKKYRPKDDAILMFDVYTKEACTVTVKLIQDGGDYSTTYQTVTSIGGGRVWYNLKFEKSKFKTTEGMILKTYDKITRIVFQTEKAGLINNVLWV